jgi:glycyl-tRNA synthetase
VPAEHEADLLVEVAGLVEAPIVISGAFDAAFLRLPRAVLVTAMRKHQRYFPLVRGGDLLNAFVTVANGAVDAGAVRAGNEAVLRARLQDAAFFYDQDLKGHLEDRLPALEGTLFHRELGSMLAKSQRVAALAPRVARLLGFSTAVRDAAAEAARLCKADLATAVVTEMTSLAGVMGKHYAELEGISQVRRLASRLLAPLPGPLQGLPYILSFRPCCGPCCPALPCRQSKLLHAVVCFTTMLCI